MKTSTIGTAAELMSGQYDPNKFYEFWLVKRNASSTSYYYDKTGQKPKKIQYPFSATVKMEYPTIRFNNDTKRNETVWVRHSATEPTIYRHEQNQDGEIAITRLKFVNGYYRVRGNDTTLLDAIRLDNRNASNPDRDKNVAPIYFLRDDEKAFEKHLEIEDAKFEAVAFVKNPENFDVILAYARTLLSESEYQSLCTNPRMIVYRMRGFAEKNPKQFMDGLKSPSILKKHFVLQAIEDGVVLFDQKANGIYWRNGELIHQSPIGKSPINSFVDRILEDRTGNTESIYNLILEKMGRIDNKPEHKPYTPVATIENKGFEELYTKLFASGKITKSGVWLTFNNKRYQGKSSMEKEYQDNATFAQLMRAEAQ